MSMPVLRVSANQVASRVVVNEDTAHGAAGYVDMDGKMFGKRHKSELAKPRAKRTKEASGKKKGVKVEETAKEDRVEEPIKTNCS